VTKETTGIDLEVVCLADVPIDDYGGWGGELPKEFRGDKTILYVHDLQIKKGGRCLTSCLESIAPKSPLPMTVKS
jgi:hypothetical protein